MADITQRGATQTVTQYTGTTITFTKPAGVVSGDFLITFIDAFVGGGTFTAPAGWSTPENVVFDAGNDDHAYCFTLVAGGSEPASYAWTQAGGVLGTVNASGVLTAWFNVDTSGGGLDAHASQNNGNTSTCIAPSVTATVAGDLLLTAFNLASLGSFSGGVPGGMTLVDRTDPASGGNGMMLVKELRTNTGATGTRSTTMSEADTNGGVSALLKVSGGGGTSANVNLGSLFGTVTLGSVTTSLAGDAIVTLPRVSATGSARPIAGAGANSTVTNLPSVTSTGKAAGMVGTTAIIPSNAKALGGVVATGSALPFVPGVQGDNSVNLIGVTATGVADTFIPSTFASVTPRLYTFTTMRNTPVTVVGTMRNTAVAEVGRIEPSEI